MFALHLTVLVGDLVVMKKVVFHKMIGGMDFAGVNVENNRKIALKQ